MTRQQPKNSSSDSTAKFVYIGGAILVVALLGFSLTRLFRPAPSNAAPFAAAAATGGGGSPSADRPGGGSAPDPGAASPGAADASLPPMQSARGGGEVPAFPPQITPPVEEIEPTAAQVKDVPRARPEEVYTAFENKSATIIDVRDKDSYLEGHIPGALHIPLSYIAGEVPYLPKDKPIITYCTCPNEESSGGAALKLEGAGIRNVSAMLGGFDEWRNRGYPVETGLPAK